MLGQQAPGAKKGSVRERWCWRWRCDHLVLTETRNSHGGDYGGGVHCVVRGAKCYVGYSIGYDCTFSEGGLIVEPGTGGVYTLCSRDINNSQEPESENKSDQERNKREVQWRKEITLERIIR